MLHNLHNTRLADQDDHVDQIYYCLTMDYPPMRGGVARYLSNLAEVSAGQMEVLVPLEHPGSGSSGQGGTSVRRVRFWWWGWPRWLPLIKRCLELKEGIIFVSHVLPTGTAAFISKVFGGPEYIVLFHGTDLKRINSPWKKWLLNRICKQAKLLVTNSEATSDALKRLVTWAEPLVLTPGVAMLPETESRISIRERFGLSEKAQVILSVCRLVERKGIDTLLRVMARFIGKMPNLELVVVGKGPYADQLHKLADLLKVPVRWIEGATDQDVADWYRAADVFCLPSREAVDDVEGFGIVFLEAAAAGLPVIAGKGWGTEEAVEDRITGLLVEPSVDKVQEALEKLLKDDDLRQRFGQAGRLRAQVDFKWRDRWIALKTNIESRISKVAVKLEQDSILSEADIRNSKFDDVAVVVPCWNHAKDLEKTLQALSLQTLMPKEIIVVDNNSNDNPAAVVEKFKSKLPVSCVLYSEKQGAPAARNQGAALTSAPFILFLDADVELTPDALMLMRQKLQEHPEAAFAYSDFYWDDKLFHGQAWSASDLAHKNWIHTSSLIRRDQWMPFDESLKRFQDWDLWISMSKRGCTGAWIEKPLFRVSENNNRKGKISHWIPAFVHQMPWPILGWTPDEIRRYREAEAVIKEKHGII